jgi:hypothetical protein
VNDRDWFAKVDLTVQDLDHLDYDPLGSCRGALELLHREGSWLSVQVVWPAQQRRQIAALRSRRLTP